MHNNQRESASLFSASSACKPAGSVTRGYGLLENFLARQRCVVANRLIEPTLRRGSLLDIGCGEHPLFLLGTDFQERFGLDQIVDPQAIERFRTSGVTLVNHDLHKDERLPFAGNRFSTVTMLAVIEHLEERKAAGLAREIHRVLRPGGTYVLTTPAAWSDRLLRMLASARLVSPVEIGEHKAAYTPAMLRRMLETAGFPPAEVQTGYFEIYLNLWATATKAAVVGSQ